MPHHISLFQNNSQNSRKSPHAISAFSIENSRSMSRHISQLKNNSKNLRKLSHPTLHSPLKIIKKTLENVL
jgi:hypothetical protein